MSKINYGALDPGIRETVRFLNEHGFATSDSGDGVSKLAAGYDPSCVLDEPHVFMHAEPSQMADVADRLLRLMEQRGVCVEPIGASKIGIQATYDPGNRTAIIGLYGVTDRALGLDGAKP